MRLKVAQELENLDQDPLFLVLIDLRKAYENLECGRLLQTMAGYWEGPTLRGLLVEFWLRQEIVTH